MATGIGEALRRARREQGRSLADAAESTRIRESHLAALEEEHFDGLGGEVYARGHLRAYAKYLGLDPDPLMAAYPSSARTAPGGAEPGRAEREGAGPGGAGSLGPPTRIRPTAAGVIVAILLVALAVALIGSIIFGRDDPSPAPTASPPAAEASPARPSPDATQVLDSDMIDIELRVSGGESWIRVVVDDAVEVESVQPDGARRAFRASRQIILRIGDAGVVFLTVNGEDQGVMGSQAEMVERTYQVGQSS